jgi:nitrous oxide reductase accessory protein NosL
MIKGIRTVVFLLIAVGALLLTAASSSDDLAAHRECGHCGMDRKAYGFSRMLVVYENGTESGVCSLHCAITDQLEHPGLKVKSLLVADRDTRALVPAETAVWVLGGSKRGVMTARAKWAFAERARAEKFVAANGGEIVTWERALEAAREDAKPQAKRKSVRGKVDSNRAMR